MASLHLNSEENSEEEWELVDYLVDNDLGLGGGENVVEHYEEVKMPVIGAFGAGEQTSALDNLTCAEGEGQEAEEDVGEEEEEISSKDSPHDNVQQASNVERTSTNQTQQRDDQPQMDTQDFHSDCVMCRSTSAFVAQVIFVGVAFVAVMATHAPFAQPARPTLTSPPTSYHNAPEVAAIPMPPRAPTRRPKPTPAPAPQPALAPGRVREAIAPSPVRPAIAPPLEKRNQTSLTATVSYSLVPVPEHGTPVEKAARRRASQPQAAALPSELSQLGPVPAPCVLCILGHATACPRCAVPVYAMLGIRGDEFRRTAALISSTGGTLCSAY